jgi:hypothetical protein
MQLRRSKRVKVALLIALLLLTGSATQFATPEIDRGMTGSALSWICGLLHFHKKRATVKNCPFDL